ncbi:hypothetical protein [Mesorhizobium sp. WSM2561]|uniref:hypothetical protein n=1 Tax=Mesorhizobium sp. WSM2561 TaxID=1040985 RepID=UPI0012EB9897|nr:hypothetical protein [Mesorhizobium sp. WSM2561]
MAKRDKAGHKTLADAVRQFIGAEDNPNHDTAALNFSFVVDSGRSALTTARWRQTEHSFRTQFHVSVTVDCRTW